MASVHCYMVNFMLVQKLVIIVFLLMFTQLVIVYYNLIVLKYQPKCYCFVNELYKRIIMFVVVVSH